MRHITILKILSIFHYLSSHWIIKFSQFFFFSLRLRKFIVCAKWTQRNFKVIITERESMLFVPYYSVQSNTALGIRVTCLGTPPGTYFPLTLICTYGLRRGVLTTYRRSILEYAIASIGCHNSHNQSDQSQRSRRVFSAFRQIHRSLPCRHWSIEIFVNKRDAVFNVRSRID